MKKAFQNMFTLALSALMIINMIPGNIYAEENETQINEAVQENVETAENKIEEISTEIAVQEVQTPSENKEEAPVKEETKIEEVKEEAPAENKTEEAVKEEALPENKIEEAEKEETPVLENKEEKKEELILTEAAVIMTSEPMEAMNSVIEAVEEAPAKAEKIKITVNFTDILKTDGTTKTGTASSTLSKNLSSWKILQAKFNNQVTYKDFTVKGTKYHFTGEWAYEDGSPVSIPMEFKYDDFNEDTIINVHPIYEKTEAARLNFYKIDNISYGSGSWANTAGSFTTYMNTLKAPSAKAHYQFLYWQDGETGQIYNAGDKFSIKATDIGDGNTKDVRLYATWQPSITLRYHSISGSTISTKEVYEDISAYGYNAPAVSGCKFLGWSLTPNGEVLAESTVYGKPALTVNPVAQNIIDLYPVYSVSYKVEHYTQGLDGSYSLRETENIEDAAYNTQVYANERSYEGFSVNGDSIRSGIAKSGLVLKLYYSRNSYTVSYEYENVPANAPALPENKDYEFGAEVKVADAKEIEGYTFQGWDTKDFTMPDEDVIIKGSYKVNSHNVSYKVDGMDIEVPETMSYEYGKQVKIAEDLKLEGYTFSGWDKKDFQMPDEDVTINGSFSINSYKVSYEYENAPENAPVLPETKEYEFNSDVKVESGLELEGYTFSGWDKENFSMPAADVVIKGSFAINTYNVRFVNDDGSLLELDEKVEYGNMASYDGQTPVKASDGRYSYTFTGWSKELSEVKEDQEYVAQYKAELIPIVSEDSPEESKPQSPSSPIKIETPEEPEVEIEEALAPLAEAEVEVEMNEAAAEIIIEDDAAPKAEFKTWALYNLIATIITALTGLFMIISFFTKKNEDEEEENEEENENRRSNWSKFLGIIPMVAAIIAFILTEDMRNVMVLKDEYTIAMIVIALFELVLAFITRNKKEEEEEEEDKLQLVEA